MRKALRRAVGVLLATGVVGLARPALAQTQLRDQTPPVRRVVYGEQVNRSEGSSRLEEMNVELALLSDAATFPYYLGARRAGGNLEVGGFVPNDAIKLHALELARRHTSLNVTDGLRIQANLNPRRPLRGAEALLREGKELLIREIGEAGRQLRLDVRPNGVVHVTGSIDSVQEKLTVSRLFRQVSGCAAVVNQLTVRPVLRDGQRVVQVMRDSSQTVPASALGLGPQQGGATPPSSEPAIQPAQHTLEAREEELRLPTIVAPKPRDDRPATAGASGGFVVLPTIKPDLGREATDSASKPVKASRSDAFAADSTSVPSGGNATTARSDALTAPKLPASWSRPRFNPDAQTQTKPATLPVPSAVAPHPVPVQPSVAPTTTVAPQLVPMPVVVQPSVAPKTPVAPQPVPVQPSVAQKTPAAQPTIIGSSVGFTAADAPSRAAPSAPPAGESPAPTVGPPLRSARRWKPAYDVRPPETDKGRPGVIFFEEEPAPSPGPPAHNAPNQVVRPVVPADLKEQVKSVCGSEARDVDVEVRRDGSLLVTVKVPNAAAEKQLTSKILTIPAMTAPNVNLAMRIGP